MAKVDIRPVAYRGSTAVLPDLLAGRIAMVVLQRGQRRAAGARRKAARVRGLFAQALGAAPDLPTMAEIGYPGYRGGAVVRPDGAGRTPQPIIDKVHQETVRVLAMPDVRKRFEDIGLDLIGGTPAEFAAVIRTEIPYWAKVIKEAGIKATE